MKMETEEGEFVADREGLGIAAGINEGLPEQASMQPLVQDAARVLIDAACLLLRTGAMWVWQRHA